jgi:hypothetical protein
VTTGVETASAVEADRRAMETRAAMNADGSTVVTARDWAANSSAVVTISGPITIAGTTVPVTGAPVKAVAVVAVIPGASPDEEAADKVAGPVIAVGRASIGIEAVVTIGADRCWSNAYGYRTDSDAHGNLCVGVPCGKKQNPQQCCIF